MMRPIAISMGDGAGGEGIGDSMEGGAVISVWGLVFNKDSISFPGAAPIGRHTVATGSVPCAQKFWRVSFFATQRF